MRKRLHLVAMLVAVPALASLWACIGEDVGAGTPTGSPDGGSTTTQDGSSQTPTDAADPNKPVEAGSGDAGPRCDPTKPFNTVETLKGISTGDDELTAYIAITPSGGGMSNLRKSTRPSRDVDFSKPAADPQLALINASSVTIPSMTANGLVLAYARTDGIYVSVRNAPTEVFPAGVKARTRANPFSAGDPFLTAGGEDLVVARDNGTNYDLDDAPRDVGKIYGDGGFIDYAIAPGVTNVNDAVADDRRPIYSSDRLTLVFASNRAPGAGANSDLYIAQRLGVSGTFTSPVRLAEPVSSPNADLPGTLSEDGCVLYFTSDRPGGFGFHDVLVARRPK